MNEIKRTIKYEADRVVGLGREVLAVPGCGQLEICIPRGSLQCGGLANSLIRRER